MKIFLSFSLLFLLVLFDSCNTTKLQTTSLKNNSWLLQSMGDRPVEAEVTLEFSEGKINGKSFCNQYFSNYTDTKDNFHFESIGATKRACPKMTEESQYFSMLSSAKGYQMKNGNLHLKCKNGNLVFAPYSPKADKTKK